MRRSLLLRVGILAVTMVGLAGAAIPAAAQGTFTLFGDATPVPGGVQIRSATTGPGYGGIAFEPSGPLTLGSLTTLSTDYKFTSGDCGLGAPRFSIVTPSGNAFVYIGPAPSYTNCPAGQQSTGNLLAPGVGKFCDLSQLGGTFYDLCSKLQTPLYANIPVTEVDLVTDNGNSTLIVNNFTVNGDVKSAPMGRVTFLNGGSYQFGAWNVGQCSGFQSINIRNEGPGTLTGGAATITGPNATDFKFQNGTQATVIPPLGPQQTYAILIQFCPSAVGMRNAKLTITADNLQGGPATIDLIGTGKLK